VAAVGTGRFGRAEQSREARFARLVALILDTIFVGILTSIATAVFGVTQFTITSFQGGSTAYGTSQGAIPWIWTAAIWLTYYTLCESLFSATPGKAMNGLRVVSDDGRPLRLYSVLVRNLLRLVDALPAMYLVGGLFVLGTQYSQRVGDLAGHTTVVFTRYAVEPGTSRHSGRQARIAFVALVLAAFVITAGFEYFERPVLVVQSQFEAHQLIVQDLQSYSLGTPTRTLGSVSYPLTARTSTKTCSGSVELSFEGFFGWTMTGGQLNCFPS